MEMSSSVKSSISFDAEKNVYIIFLNGTKFEMSREDTVSFQNKLTKTLKQTQTLFLSLHGKTNK